MKYGLTRFVLGMAALLIGFCGLVSAKENINTEVLKKSVVYIYKVGADGNADPHYPLGTGFIVQIPLLSDPNRSYLVFVTARHIVDPAWIYCPGDAPKAIALRLNKKIFDPSKDAEGTAYVYLLIESDGKPLWVHPPEDDADVAVFLINANVFADNADFYPILVSDFATDEEAKQMDSSDSIISVGLLPTFPGVKRNYPIFKFGHISTKPDEQVASQCIRQGAPKYLSLWLLSVNLVPGNSGSPIFYVTEGINVGGLRAAMLIGLQSTSFEGADVSGMTPAKYIIEAIQQTRIPDLDLYRGNPRPKPPTNNPNAKP